VAKNTDIKRVSLNRKATFDFHVEDEIEAGLVLTGTEVKSLRGGKVQMVDAYVAIEAGQAFLHQMHIAEYGHGTHGNHAPKRVRKLLLHKNEIERLHRRVKEKGFTLIPLEIYFKGARAKVRVGVCRGKRQYDKRAAIKQRDMERDLREREQR
jgi:SsrA-binding protein